MLVSSTAFACYSKVCAPPPAGKGGSERTGGRLPSAAGRANAEKLYNGAGARVQEWAGRSAKDRVADRSGAATARGLLKSDAGREVLAKILDCKPGDECDDALLREDVVYQVTAWAKSLTDVRHLPVREVLQSFIDSASTNPDRIKDYIEYLGITADIEDVSPEVLLAHMVVVDGLYEWSQDSWDTTYSLPMHSAINRRYEVGNGQWLDDAEYEHLSNGYRSRSGYETAVQLADAIQQEEYRQTQSLIRSILGPKAKTVTLYRGVRGDHKGSVGDEVQVDMNPLSSWSFIKNKASQFADRNGLLAMNVPVEMIQSVGHFGRGEYSEGEVVVIGHPSRAKVIG